MNPVGTFTDELNGKRAPQPENPAVGNSSGQQRQSEQEYQQIAEKNDYGRKKVTLTRDVALTGFQGMEGEGHVEAVSRAECQMKPHHVRLQIPHQLADCECGHDENRVEGKKIGRQGDQEIVPGNDYVAALRGGFKLFDFAAHHPGPDCVGEFVSDDIDPYGFRKQEVDGEPATGTSSQGDPNSVGSGGQAQSVPQGPRAAGAKRQQQNTDEELQPPGHANESVGEPVCGAGFRGGPKSLRIPSALPSKLQ